MREYLVCEAINAWKPIGDEIEWTLAEIENLPADNGKGNIEYVTLEGYHNERSRCIELMEASLADIREHDPVNSPDHYTAGGIEAIDYMKAKATPEEFTGYLRLNALKYLSRANLKGKSLEDCKKAQWYVNRLVKELEP